MVRGQRAERFAFVGMWPPWTGERSIGNRQKDERDWQLYAFLRCEPNELLRPIHEKVMPVIVTPDDYVTWLAGPWGETRGPAWPFDAEELGITSRA